MKLFLRNFFKFDENQTNFNREFVAGSTTFITMAYIIFVNPQLMSDSGMDYGASFVGTCLAAALACFVMGIFANWPVGLAPGMGLNAFFTYTVVGEMGYSWQVALGAVFIAGLLFFLMSVTPMRKWMLESIPLNLKIAMGAGVGLFIGFIGLKDGGIIVSNVETYISMGDLTNPETLLAALGFLLIAALSVRNVPGAIIIGVLSVTLIALSLGLVEYKGVLAYPPDVSSTFLQLDIIGALDIAMVSVIASFLFVNLFDTAGTLLGVASRANLLDTAGEVKNLDKALKADSSSSIFGAFFGCAPVTSYVESSAGVEAGGRTGFTAVVVGVFFVVAIFFSPLASMVPAYATSGALIYVAILMLGGMEKLDWADASELLPALIIIVMIPLTFSIANGIALGFLSYIILKLASGQAKSISTGAWFLSVIFITKLAYL
jgi:AGZA family xanthine/uracil permease-like MFS transporter